MDAPTYPPAVAFEQPVAAPYDELSVGIVSLAELMSAPAAWAIVLEHAPAFKFAVSAPQLKPYVTNMTVDSFIQFGVVSQAAVDAINRDFRNLPRSAWPVP
jgi:hypothetical protein